MASVDRVLSSFRHRSDRRDFLAAALWLSAGILPAAAASSFSPVSSVIELYTSQGCAFCPPADALLSALARRPEIAALSLPVDYWDYIGWRDTFAQPGFAARQRAYAGAIGENHAYTPQAIVDGLVGVVGSDRKEIEQAASSTRGRDGAMTVSQLRASYADGSVVVEVGEGGGGPADVVLVKVLRSAAVQIGRGENAGRRIVYTNVVRQISNLGGWSGAPATFRAPDTRGEGEGYVVLLQKGSFGRPGAILGALKSSGF